MLYLTDQAGACVVALASLDPRQPWTRLQPEAATGSLRRPYAVSRSGEGLVIADGDNNRLVTLDPATGASAVIDPAATPIGAFADPRGVAGADGALLVADTGNHRVALGGTGPDDPWAAYGAPSLSGSAGAGEFLAPVGVSWDGTGRILVADPGLGRLVRIDDLDGQGWAEIELPAGRRPARPYGLAPGPGGGVLVTDLANGRVLLLAPDDTVAVAIDGAADRSLLAPVAAVLDGDGLVVADAAAARLTRWALDPDRGAWTLTEHLRGDPGPLGGPQFSRLCGLTGGGAA